MLNTAPVNVGEVINVREHLSITHSLTKQRQTSTIHVDIQ